MLKTYPKGDFLIDVKPLNPILRNSHFKFCKTDSNERFPSMKPHVSLKTHSHTHWETIQTLHTLKCTRIFNWKQKQTETHFDKVHRINGANILINSFFAWLCVKLHWDTAQVVILRVAVLLCECMPDICTSECETLVCSAWIVSCKWVAFINAVKDHVSSETVATLLPNSILKRCKLTAAVKKLNAFRNLWPQSYRTLPTTIRASNLCARELVALSFDIQPSNKKVFFFQRLETHVRPYFQNHLNDYHGILTTPNSFQSTEWQS